MHIVRMRNILYGTILCNTNIWIDIVSVGTVENLQIKRSNSPHYQMKFKRWAVEKEISSKEKNLVFLGFLRYVTMKVTKHNKFS